MEDEIVQAQDSNEQEEEALETSDEESSSELETRLAKAEELAQNYKIRAEKAERLAKASKEVPSTQKQTPTAGDLSQKDVIYLAKADIHDEDFDEVTKYASKNGVTVKEAHEYLKPILAVKDEQRRIANATNTSSSKRGSGKVSSETIIENASKGRETDPEALAEARMAMKLANRK